MDIGLREWLIIGGLLVIGLIVFDGWRRMKGQRNTLKIDIDSNFVDSEENDHNSELPNGGARMLRDIKTGLFYVDPAADPSRSHERIDPGFDHLAEYVEPEHTKKADAELKRNEPGYESEYGPEYRAPASEKREAEEQLRPSQASSSSKSDRREAGYFSEDEELDPLFDDIPEILSPARKSSTDLSRNDVFANDTAQVDQSEFNRADLKTASITQRSESISAVQEKIATDQERASAVQKRASIAQKKAGQSEFLDLEQPITVLMRQASEKTGWNEDPLPQEEESTSSTTDKGHPSTATAPESSDSYRRDTDSSETDEAVFIDEALSEEELIDEPGQDSLFDDKKLAHARSDRKAREQAPEPEEVLVITVVGKDAPLEGQTLLQVVLACGMRFGDMNLFHRFEEGIDKGAVQFSMANAVNPGTFDLEHMSGMTTPGVSFFMSMGEPADAKNAFECMLATAETVSKHVGGDLLDENRSVMRPQTKAHYRERIREFELHNRHRRG
ncbi:cell division protein ZipA [Neptunomonas antarctica]|uniref:Cell division protein ZipA n=1 Tax=Neptunomonas antarctica TaxID=619304 RepID=A0A1N7JCY9_9GAMM|nr:cell division protein ZipA [Neptunomonas antarctica]SIS47188.1 cell division protein ZipA [Neptunomonas antarctica]